MEKISNSSLSFVMNIKLQNCWLPLVIIPTRRTIVLFTGVSASHASCVSFIYSTELDSAHRHHISHFRLWSCEFHNYGIDNRDSIRGGGTGCRQSLGSTFPPVYWARRGIAARRKAIGAYSCHSQQCSTEDLENLELYVPGVMSK